MTPNNIGAGSSKKAWWICGKCSYEWQSVIASRNQGAGCPNCDRKRKVGNKYAVKKN
jgi:rubrerythrin